MHDQENFNVITFIQFQDMVLIIFIFIIPKTVF